MLDNNYEKQKAEEFIQGRMERIIETIKLLDTGAEKVSEYQRVCSQECLTGFIRKVCNKRRTARQG